MCIRDSFATHGEPLLTAYLRLELAEQTRIVTQNDEWVALVPFWAVWPFELLLLPRQRVASVEALNHGPRDGLAAILQQVTAAYNRVFHAPFPYSMGLHPAPFDGEHHLEWLLHAHFYPPLLRSATVRKFMVGFELLGLSLIHIFRLWKRMPYGREGQGLHLSPLPNALNPACTPYPSSGV